MKSLILGVVGQKGGTGKSRLAQAFAVACCASKVDVLIADMDVGPTGSMAWAEVRRMNGWKPEVRVERFGRRELASLDGRGDIVVVDTAGFADKLTRELAEHAHLVVVPFGTDLGDWQPTVDLLHQFVNGGIEPERLAPVIVRAASDAKAVTAREYMTQAGYPPLKCVTQFNASYQDAFNVGKAMVEAAHEGPRKQAERQVVEIGSALRASQMRLAALRDGPLAKADARGARR